MPYSLPLNESNAASREALRELFQHLTPDQYTVHLGDGWTVGSTLAHVALFDHRAIKILERWELEGVSPSPNDVDIINAALVPFLAELSPAAIAKLALKYAEELDAKLAALPDSVLDQFESVAKHPFNLSRAIHRNEHITQIKEKLSF